MFLHVLLFQLLPELVRRRTPVAVSAVTTPRSSPTQALAPGRMELNLAPEYQHGNALKKVVRHELF